MGVDLEGSLQQRESLKQASESRNRAMPRLISFRAQPVCPSFPYYLTNLESQHGHIANRQTINQPGLEHFAYSLSEPILGFNIIVSSVPE